MARTSGTTQLSTKVDQDELENALKCFRAEISTFDASRQLADLSAKYGCGATAQCECAAACQDW